MPTLSFVAPFTKNNNLVFSSQEIKSMFLSGIRFNTSYSSNSTSFTYTDEDVEFQVKAAQKEVENYLGIKLFRQIYSETLQFDNDDWRFWGFIKTSYMVVCPLKLDGYLNTIKQTQFPPEWLSSKRESGDELYHRSIYVVPAGNTGAVNNSIAYSGIIPNLGYLNAGRIPNYWTATYTTGFNVIPNDIIQIIGMLAAINILYVAGNNTIGIPGAGSTSISIDGLSQSISSNNYYLDRIKQYNLDLIRKLDNAKGTYRGYNFGSC